MKYRSETWQEYFKRTESETWDEYVARQKREEMEAWAEAFVQGVPVVIGVIITLAIVWIWG